MIECFRNILPKGVTGAARANTPAASVIRVRPEQVAHRALMRNFLDSVKRSNIIKGIDARRETTVETEDLVVDEGSQREVVEKIGKEFPNVGVAVFPKTLVVETVHLGDLTGLVVTAQNGDALGVSDLKGN